VLRALNVMASALAWQPKNVCRCHGARGGAPKGEANGAYRHGGHTQEAKAGRRALAELMRAVHDTLTRLGQADQV
jgi:hypothetical protein